MKIKSLLSITMAGLLVFTAVPDLSAKDEVKKEDKMTTITKSKEAEAKSENVLQSDSLAKHEIDKWLDAAMEKDYSTNAMIQAYSEAQKKWDTELNGNYNILMKELDKTAQESLKKAQNAWIKQRDLEFNVIKNIYGKKDGSMYRPMAVCAAMEIVKSRALELKHYYEILKDGEISK